MVDDIAEIVLSRSSGTETPLGIPILPSIALICKTCGNTQLYNVFLLGLGDVLEVPPAGAKKGDG